jgi:hypothetical protein
LRLIEHRGREVTGDQPAFGAEPLGRIEPRVAGSCGELEDRLARLRVEVAQHRLAARSRDRLDLIPPARPGGGELLGHLQRVEPLRGMARGLAHGQPPSFGRRGRPDSWCDPTAFGLKAAPREQLAALHLERLRIRALLAHAPRLPRPVHTRIGELTYFPVDSWVGLRTA